MMHLSPAHFGTPKTSWPAVLTDFLFSFCKALYNRLVPSVSGVRKFSDIQIRRLQVSSLVSHWFLILFHLLIVYAGRDRLQKPSCCPVGHSAGIYFLHKMQKCGSPLSSANSEMQPQGEE